MRLHSSWLIIKIQFRSKCYNNPAYKRTIVNRCVRCLATRLQNAYQVHIQSKIRQLIIKTSHHQACLAAFGFGNLNNLAHISAN